MSMMMCAYCGDAIDTDYDVEHFTEEGYCEEKDEWITKNFERVYGMMTTEEKMEWLSSSARSEYEVLARIGERIIAEDERQPVGGRIIR